jgi:hypothetical protein
MSSLSLLSLIMYVCILIPYSHPTGYCVCPLNVASLLCHVLSLTSSLWAVRFAVVLLFLAWSMRAAVGFMGQMLPQDRKGLGVFPILLFYLSLAWMILVQ